MYPPTYRYSKYKIAIVIIACYIYMCKVRGGYVYVRVGGCA